MAICVSVMRKDCVCSTGIIRLFTTQIATEGFSTVFGQLRCALWHTKSIKSRKFTVYGLGKGLSLKRLTSSALFSDKAEQFCEKDATVDDVIDAREAALVCLCSGKEGDNLDGLRYSKFCDKIATNKVHIRPQTLPPTSAAARYHNMRVYLPRGTAVAGCLQYEGDLLGMMTKDENLVPVMTDLPPALDELLRVIRCNCTTDCSTARCSCRQHSLECSPACGQCRGIGCSNSIAADISDEDDDDDDDDR